MQTRTLGAAALKVSALGLGCMGMTLGYGPAKPKEEMKSLIHEAFDLGVTFFDTAECYGPFENEILVGEALQGFRDKVVLATKCGIQINDRGEEQFDARPETIRRSLEGSLTRLKTDVIDLYFLHRVDPKVPVEEVAEVMGDFIREGKIRGWGLSEAGPKTIARAQAVTKLTALQSEYSMMYRAPEEKILPLLKAENIGFVPFSPLANGFLTGAIKAEAKFGEDDFRHIIPRLQGENLQANMRLVAAVQELARAKKATPAQIALAWVLAQGDFIAPIPGTTRLERLKENLGALRVEFSADELAHIRELLDATPVAGERFPEQLDEQVAE